MLISKFIKSTSLIIILSLSLAGCSSSEDSSYERPELIGSVIESTMNTDNEIFTKKFNLGSASFEERGKTIPFEKEGIIAVPKDISDTAPVVFIFHGRHSDKEKTDFEDGFSYLAKDLAKNGIIAISVDNAVNYTFAYGEPLENERLSSVYEEHLSSLKLANEGQDIGYGIDLKDKIDFSNIGLIGHSVAGSGIFQIATDQINKDKHDIKALLSVAPAYNAVIDNFPDIESSIIVSEYDGDVIHAGADLYKEILEKDKNRINPLGLTYLIGGNHSYFNTVLEDKDFAIIPTTNGTYPEKINREQQMNFLSNYAVDFMKSSLNIDNSSNPIFDKDIVTPSNLYGCEVMNKIYYNSYHNILDKNNYKDVVFSNIEREEIVESFIPDKDKFDLFRTIENIKELNLLKIDWKDKDSYIEIPYSSIDASNFSQLGLSWALNSPSELNSLDKEVMFDIVLVDNNNKESRVSISNSNISALKYIQGEIVINEYYEGNYHNYWSRATPISNTNIPLDVFDNIKLDNLKSLKIHFNNTESGSLVIDRLFFVK